MKYLQIYESFEQIDAWCKKHSIGTPLGVGSNGVYTINVDGSISVEGDIFLSAFRLGDVSGKLPYKFGRVGGDFDCSHNSLTTLDNCPSYVGENFECSANKISSFLDGPKYVGRSFISIDNPYLIEVCGFPGYFNENNEIIISGSPVSEILDLVGSEKLSRFINLLNDYYVIRNGKTRPHYSTDGYVVIKDRLEEALYNVGYDRTAKFLYTHDFKNYKLV